MNNVEFFKQAGYGMMMHFGLYSILGGEYKGRFGDNYAEWIGSHFAIPIKEYEQLAKVFNPIYFDADAIIKFAKDCGMKYFVVTTMALLFSTQRWINIMLWMPHLTARILSVSLPRLVTNMG